MDVAARDRSDHRPSEVPHRRRRAQDPRAELRVRSADQREAHGEVRRPQGAPLPGRRYLSTRPRSSRPTGRSSRSTARSTWATTAGSSCPSLPENLVAKPTLVWLLRNQTARPQRVEASYLTSGITWKADYVMVINAADTLLRSHGLGDHRQQERRHLRQRRAQARGRRRQPRAGAAPGPARAWRWRPRPCRPAVASRDFASEGFFEYHLYTLDGRTTIKDNQTKQLSLLAASEVPIDKQLHLLRRRGLLPELSTACRSRTRRSASTSRSRTARRTAWACRCPRARCASTRPTRSGSQQFIGEDWIDHTPKDEKVKIKMGDAFDVVGERTQKDCKKLASEPLRGRVGDLPAQPQERGRRPSRSSSPCRATGRCSARATRTRRSRPTR